MDLPRFRKYFRFPMLKESDTAAKRDALKSFVAQHGYRTSHVTIDKSDWAIDSWITAKDSAADVKPYRDFYMEHMWARAEYYDPLARRVLGRPVKHMVLVYFNLLNGLFLSDLIEMFKSKGGSPSMLKKHSPIRYFQRSQRWFRPARASSGSSRKRRERS